MTTFRADLPNGGRLEVYSEPLSDALAAEGAPRLNALARQGAAAARAAARPSGRRLIGMKPAKEFELESGDIGRPRSELSSMLRVPVALIFNNSRYAVEQEVGSVKKIGERPMRKAIDAVRGRGVRAVLDAELNSTTRKVTRSRASSKKGRRR